MNKEFFIEKSAAAIVALASILALILDFLARFLVVGFAFHLCARSVNPKP